jgi:polysaccharide biosynthesis protein PslG
MRRLLPLLLLTAVLASLGAAGAAQAKVAVGIADNKSDMFTDPRFTALQVKYVRVMVPYDAMHDNTLRTWLDGWMAGAQAAGERPLVTFDRSQKRTSHNPSAAQMATSLKDVRKRYPFVKEFATWNEANINKRPETVARWWTAMRKACPTCTILGADLLDRNNVGTWAKRFVKAAKRTPKVWGLHNYNDANLLRTTGTRKLLSAVKGAVWFTETGGVVSRNNGSAIKFPTGPAHAAKATRFVFSTLAKLSPRVQRVYIYHWNTGVTSKGGVKDQRTWDSGLIGPDDKPRPSLSVLDSLLHVKTG